MVMKTKIDPENWNRRDHFRYFGSATDPYFGVVVNVDCTAAYNQTKRGGTSFFLTCLYRSIEALNKIENFRYRLINGEVWLYDLVHASSTVGRGDGTFGFGFFEYVPCDFEGFCRKGQAEIDAVQACSGLRVDENAKRLDVVHFTVLPWFSFTGFKHERSFTRSESIPKIAFGKVFEAEDKKMLPVSISANHGLVDAYHVGKYLEHFQEGLDASA
jgi:chloramphenicol O-acetyltransferase type A